MLLPDADVLLSALRPDASGTAEQVRGWLERALSGTEALGLSELALAATIRIATHPRVFAEPTPPGAAVDFADTLLAVPGVRVVRPGARHWQLFSGLVADHRLRGNDVPDAYFAAIALEAGARLVTRDRGFARFEGLQRVDPLT
ncbi:MAG: PIN domain-containing protein [Nocardioides sp.]|nr:PIN domain-containing protein [Nocardioides sp.]